GRRRHGFVTYGGPSLRPVQIGSGYRYKIALLEAHTGAGGHGRLFRKPEVRTPGNAQPSSSALRPPGCSARTTDTEAWGGHLDVKSATRRRWAGGPTTAPPAARSPRGGSTGHRAPSRPRSDSGGRGSGRTPWPARSPR